MNRLPRVKRGDPFRPDDWNALVDEAERLEVHRNGVGTQWSDGWVPEETALVRNSARHVWKMGIATTDPLSVQFSVPGNADDLIPLIGDVEITDEPAPTLAIPDTAFARVGMASRALVMLRYELDHNTWQAERVTVVAVPAPIREAWIAYKLLAIVRRTDAGEVKIFPQCFFDLAFYATRRNNTTGTFKPWHLAKP